jgi:hypothetical protein
MDNQLNEGQLLINRVKLLMGYDMSKTLNENTHHIFEQPDSRFDTPETKSILKKGQEELDKKQAVKDAEEEANKYPNWCRYPDKALPYPENPEGAEGEDAIIKNEFGIRFCYYPSPSNVKSGEVSGIFIPENSAIAFWDVQGISDTVDKFAKDYPKDDKKLLISNLSKVLPIGTVRAFIAGEEHYIGYLSRTVGDVLWRFGYYRNLKTKEPYTPPEWVDERGDWDRFIDKWGFQLQIAAAVATLIAGFFSFGATWGISDLLWIEIFIEAGIGGAVAWREYEKGNNVAGTFSIVTAMLPMLKVSKWFRGIDANEFKILSETLANSGLSKTSTVKDYVEFYNGLTPGGKKIMDKLLSNDKITREALWYDLKASLDAEIPKMVDKFLPKLIKKNPKLLKDIKTFEKLWVRELSTNLSVGVIALLTELGFGDQLNNKNEKLDGVYQKIPKSLQKEFTYNLVNNPEKAGKIVDNVSEKVNKKYLDELTHTDLKDSVESSGANYTEIK